MRRPSLLPLLLIFIGLFAANFVTFETKAQSAPELSEHFPGFTCLNPNSPDSFLALEFDAGKNTYRAHNAFTSVWMNGLVCWGSSIGTAPVFLCNEQNGTRGLRFEGRTQKSHFVDIYERRISVSDQVEIELAYSHEGLDGQATMFLKKFQFDVRHCRLNPKPAEVNP